MCFFFSSRRRHTIYIGDWSSDVCSSDLARQLGYRGTGVAELASGIGERAEPQHGRQCLEVDRSEERRVGKERRSPRTSCRKKKHTARGTAPTPPSDTPPPATNASSARRP